jgi:hypothetical protein
MGIYRARQVRRTSPSGSGYHSYSLLAISPSPRDRGSVVLSSRLARGRKGGVPKTPHGRCGFSCYETVGQGYLTEGLMTVVEAP